MLPFYQWLQTKLPRQLADLVVVLTYSVLILLTLAFSMTYSPGFIYWDH